MVRKAAAAYARLLKEHKDPMPLADFVSAFVANGPPESLIEPRWPPQRQDLPPNEELDGAPLSNQSGLLEGDPSSARFTFSPCEVMQTQSLSGHYEDLAIGSNQSRDASRAGSLFDSTEDFSSAWSAASLITGDSSAASSVGTPSSSRGAHSKHPSLSSITSGLSGTESVAAFAVLGSPVKGLPALKTSATQPERVEMMMPLRRSKRSLPQRTRITPPSTLQPLDRPLSARTSLSSATSDAPPDWASWNRKTPSLDSMHSPLSPAHSELQRSRSSTLASGSAPHSNALHLVDSAASARLRAEFGDPTHDARVEESKIKRHRSEAKRTQDLSNSFQNLKDCLGNRVDGRLIKVQVLEVATARIKALEQENVDLHGHRGRLLEENTRLQTQLQVLTQRFQDSGLDPGLVFHNSTNFA